PQAPAAPAAASPPAPAEPAAGIDAAPPASPQALAFQSWRDPTLSPYDVLRIKQNEIEREAKRQELRKAGERRGRANPAFNPERIVELQGIVSASDGSNRAIVNGEVVSEGDAISGVRVLRITTRGVVFGYKNKRFMKAVNR
ncbi:MAG: general secretion pathway protein GspB, partial [Elusimicrobia bacterium]|nr:general secretion pathway protein GspB [Elusimicrobiota bacterium]